MKEFLACAGNRQDVMEHYIKILAEQGITHVDIWCVPSDASNDSEVRKHNEYASRSPQSSRKQLKDQNTVVEDKEGGKRGDGFSQIFPIVNNTSIDY
jgi:hypothetical protein